MHILYYWHLLIDSFTFIMCHKLSLTVHGIPYYTIYTCKTINVSEISIGMNL